MGADGLAQEHFGGAAFGDRKRSKRLLAVAERVFAQPAGTWPDRFRTPAELKAFYRLMNQEQVTHATVLAPQRERTWQRMRAETEPVLNIHDTTTLDYSGLSIAGLGQVGDGNGRGYECHNTLAVAAGRREVLGLANQILHRRATAPPGETREQRRRRADRESRLWEKGSAALPPAPPGRLWVDVCDRGADITEFLAYEENQGKKYTVRSQHNRRVLLEQEGKIVAAKLHDVARALPARGQKVIEIGGREGKPSRTATVNIAWTELRIVPPRQPRGEHDQAPLRVCVVRVWEEQPPAGCEAVEWILLTNVPVVTLAEALERVEWYQARWIIEEYHKALKTGCNIEKQQFTTEEALQPAIALLSVAAVTLLNLRDASRRPDADTRLATEVVPARCVQTLSRWRHGEVRPNWTVQEFFLALARLGGHQNRKHDHRPGWLVLWRGWTKLQIMLEVVASLRLKRSG